MIAKTNQNCGAVSAIATHTTGTSSLLPSRVIMNPSTPTYDPVICMMRKNREAAWMIDDLSPEMVVVPDDGFDFLDLSQQKLLAIHALKSISLKWARLKSQIVMLGKTNI